MHRCQIDQVPIELGAEMTKLGKLGVDLTRCWNDQVPK